MLQRYFSSAFGRKNRIIGLLALLLIIGCAGSRVFVAPGFTGKALTEGGIAVLPVLAGETGRSVPGVESYCRTTGEEMAVMLREKVPALKVIGPAEVSSIFGKEGLVDEYSKLIENYQRVGMIDTEISTKLSKPLGAKYLMLTQIQSLFSKDSNAIAVLSSRIWDNLCS